MFNTFKNTELFRYFIRIDLNKNFDKIIKQNSSNFSLIAGSIFSGAFSILGTYFGMNDYNSKTLPKMVITSVLFIILFIVSMQIYKFGCFFTVFIKNLNNREKLPDKEKIKEYIDDFDHIACDNILISQNFINAYKAEPNEHLREFYYYEIIYYSSKSMDIINRLFINKKLCINDKNNIERVHLYRVENALNMLSELYLFIHANKSSIKIELPMKKSLEHEIIRLENTLKRLHSECDAFKKEKYQ